MKLKCCPMGHVAHMNLGNYVSCSEYACWQGAAMPTAEAAATEWNSLMQALEDARRFQEIVQHLVNHTRGINTDGTIRLSSRSYGDPLLMKRHHTKEGNWKILVGLAEKVLEADK